MHSRTILVADPQTHLLNAITAKLRTGGFLTTTTDDGLEAHALAREIQPDLIVVDCQLPRLSGPELCVKLACDPLTAHIPVVMMAAGGFDASAIPADNIVRVIGKPFRPQLLFGVVQDVLTNELSTTCASESPVLSVS